MSDDSASVGGRSSHQIHQQRLHQQRRGGGGMLDDRMSDNDDDGQLRRDMPTAKDTFRDA
ncbi:hypothetical protein GGTG_04714 [Gaeumannomyces tritici R3-111a-1]|uniref:Uncharacterized protein n=1 Tax=Gaeumannomyces tritici (strain R3-111a-1) TaxID=644352 RepID=J3NTW5_GAET3|nr:hypothetical protein GGTG_04714 [Gaeumannomyces tritici R3-111a-1]EJT79630.1 hypothetical protein GGTG_04714 [Gaeumannomyces tritici R3-111a-1]